MTGRRIWHLVAFRLKQEKGSPEAKSFIAEGKAALEGIEGVDEFESLEQVFGQTDLDYCYSMEFADQAAYDRYFAAPSHMEFGGRRWHEVIKHLMIDLQPVGETTDETGQGQGEGEGIVQGIVQGISEGISEGIAQGIGGRKLMNGKQLRHMVLFCLKHEKGSPEAESFMSDGKSILEKIAGVQRFEALKQISEQTEYDYCFSMEFADQASYDSYSNDPVHNDFVNRRWKPEVSKYLVVDLQQAD